MNEEASNRPPVKKLSNVHSVIGDKRGKAEDEQPSRPSVLRPPMGPPKRVSNMRQVCVLISPILLASLKANFVLSAFDPQSAQHGNFIRI